MGVPTIEKDHLMINASESFFVLIENLSLAVIIVHSYLIINLVIIVNCHTGYFLLHNYV